MAAETWTTDMATAAISLLDALGTAQRKAAEFRFADASRTEWTYLPEPHHGLRMAELDQDRRNLVLGLVATALSVESYGQVCSIIALEDVLDVLEKRSLGRNSGNYWVAVYGTPGGAEWAWRFEGHHVSVNMTIAGGRVGPTPLFFGANPHESAVRPLGWEEDWARALLRALDGRQRTEAVFDAVAPDDILTGVRAQVGPQELKPLGVRGADLGEEARRCLLGIVSTYTGRVRHAEAPSADECWFAWAGGIEHGEPHYYRVQGPGLLVEYDNTQDGANHSHSVWRIPGDDFGASLLERHRAQAH